MKKYLFFIFALTVVLGFAACGNDDDGGDPPCSSTYDADVKAIVDATCAYAGCHDGTGVNTFIPEYANDFTTFAGMVGVTIDSSTFSPRAIVDMDMPPVAFVPPGNPAELTAAQIDILTCWRDNGYPEN